MADKELSFPSQYVIKNTLTVPFTFTVYHTDEQFTLQAGESVRFDIKTYGEYTYYEKICKEVELQENGLGNAATYSFIDGASKTVLTDTTFAPYRENFTYIVKSGDILTMPLDSLAKGAYYVNLGVGDVAGNIQVGTIWTGKDTENPTDSIVFARTGQKTVDDKLITVYKVYGEVPYLQADMYFEAGNRVYCRIPLLGSATSRAVTIGGTTVTYNATDYAFASRYTVFANPTGIVSVDVTSGKGEGTHHYYEFDFTNTTNQAPHEGLGTVFVSNLTSSGSTYTFTVLNQPTEGLKVVGKVSEDRAIPIEYHQDLSDWIEMTKDGGNWVLTDETPISPEAMMTYVNIAYVTEDNLAVAGGAGLRNGMVE